MAARILGNGFILNEPDSSGLGGEVIATNLGWHFSARPDVLLHGQWQAYLKWGGRGLPGAWSYRHRRPPLTALPGVHELNVAVEARSPKGPPSAC